MMRCDICAVDKPGGEFSASTMNNRCRRTIRCLDCSSPPCMFLPRCETCTKCRNQKCNKNSSTEAGKALGAQELQASFEEVMNFACQCCKYVPCVVRQPDGTLCCQKRRENARAKAKKSRTAYSCGECQTWLLSQKSLQEAAAPSGGQ